MRSHSNEGPINSNSYSNSIHPNDTIDCEKIMKILIYVFFEI